MPVRWVVDEEHPDGYAVEMTAEEAAQRDADVAAFEVLRAAEEDRAENAETIRAAIADQMAKIRTARNAIANGNLFSGLSVNERTVIDGLLQDDLYVGRLLLNQLEDTG